MNIIIKPIITEKATSQSELYNCYTFLVNSKANKVEIKKAVESIYGVNVNRVRTLNYGPIRKTKYTKTGIQKKLFRTYGRIHQLNGGNSMISKKTN